MNQYLMLIVCFLISLLGCGGGTTSETSAQGGQGGATSTATAGQGGTGGAEPCVEPTPEGWAGPFQPYAATPAGYVLTVLSDEAGGLAGTGPKIGPFACAHDFRQVGIAYWTKPIAGYAFNRPAAIRLDFVTGDADGNPAAAPVFAEPTCYTDGSEPACGPLAIEDNYTMTFVEIVPLHVEPGEVIYPTVQLDSGVGLATSKPLASNPGWYYAPPGSAAGGPMGLWAALDKPPPGVPAYHFAPVIRLYE